MSAVWLFKPWLPYEIGLFEWSQQCSFVNREELSRARPAPDTFAPADFPTARLELLLEYFCADCFLSNSFVLVSQDLRDAMALGPQNVQYLPVDASLSAPLPRSKNYMIMHVPVIENVADVDQSDYMFRHMPGGSKSVLAVWSIAMRRDASPKHELFRDDFFQKHIFCTDEFAVRVLQRKCTGLRFLDLRYLGREPVHFRTLGGIEEGEWDLVQKQHYSNMVQPM